MSPLTTLLSIIPQVLESTIRTRNLYKCIPIGMEEVKLSLFVDNIIFYIENPIESTKKVTELFFMSLINVQDVRLMNKISYRSIPYPNDEK